MAPLARTPALVLLALALALACDLSVGQMGGMGGGDPFADWTPEGVGVVKSDLPYIQCGVSPARVAEAPRGPAPEERGGHQGQALWGAADY